MSEMQEPAYQRAEHLIGVLADEEGYDLDADRARRMAASVAEYAAGGRHPVLLVKLMRAIGVPESVTFESAMAVCHDDTDRALIWSELFLDEAARAAITGETE